MLHTLQEGVVIFAPSDATDVSINGAPVATLKRDGYLQLAPGDFPSGTGVYTISASKPVVIQTLGRANAFNDLGTYLGGVSMRHWYESTGTYEVTLTVTDSLGQTPLMLARSSGHVGLVNWLEKYILERTGKVFNGCS